MTQWELPCLLAGTFATPEEAQVALNVFARQHGYGLVKDRTYKDKHDVRRRVVYVCDRHGVTKPSKKRPGAKRRPNASSRRCDCSMKIDVVRVLGTCNWVIDPRGKETIHNHAPSLDPSSHPVHRRADMTSEVRDSIITDGQTAVRAAQTLARINADNPYCSIAERDIYNQHQSAMRLRLNGKTRTQYLLDMLQSDEYEKDYLKDTDNRLTHLFFAHDKVLQIFKANPDAILLDCTYKTNEFDLPLLNMVGVTGMNTTIHLAQVFLRNEA